MTKKEEHYEISHKCFICGEDLREDCLPGCADCSEYCDACWEGIVGRLETQYESYNPYDHTLPIPMKDLGMEEFCGYNEI